MHRDPGRPGILATRKRVSDVATYLSPTTARMASLKFIHSEEQIQKVLSDISNKKYSSVRAAAKQTRISRSTLQARINGVKSRVSSHESSQVLSEAEERSLVWWLTRLTRTGFPASPQLAIQMAEYIREQRVQLSCSPVSFSRPIHRNWIYRFQSRSPEIRGLWTRQIENARHRAISYDNIKPWFDAVVEQFVEHQYSPKHIYNMDEVGYGIGESQSSRALINKREKSSWKVINGKQEWVTAIECVNAAGESLPPMIIFRAKHLQSSWIPRDAPINWRFSTSNKGWTTDSHGYEWLAEVFEPETLSEDLEERRLLIMDGHSSHMTAIVIRFCMKHDIDLLILPAHTSHVLQPLDVGVFSPLKRAMAKETDALAKLDAGTIPRREWVEMYIRARGNAIIEKNVLGGWKGAGLWPLSPISILQTLVPKAITARSSPHTPRHQTFLDTTLLQSSPPDGTQLREANVQLNSALDAVSGMASPIKRYIKRLGRTAESLNSRLSIVEKELNEHRMLVSKRKAITKGKRVELKGRFVFSTEEVLQIAQRTEQEAAARKAKKGSKKRKAAEMSENEMDEGSEKSDSDLEGSCIVVA